MKTIHTSESSNADTIRGHFAAFFDSLPRTNPREFLPEHKNNGAESSEVKSKIRQILNCKKEFAEQEKIDQNNFLLIKQNVFQSEEVLKMMHNQVQNLTEEKKNLISQLAAAENENNELLSVNDEIKSNFQSLLNNLNDELSSKEIEIQTLRAKIDAFTEAASIQESLVQTMQIDDETEKNYQMLIEKFQQDLSQYQTEVIRLKSDKESGSSLIAELNHNKVENERLRKTLDKIYKDLKEEKAKHEQKSEELKQERDIHSGISQESALLKAELAHKDARMKEFESQLSLLKAENNNLKTTNNEQSRKVQTGKNEIEQLKAAQEELLKSKNELRDLTEKLSQEKTVSAKLSSDLAIKGKDLDYLKESTQAKMNELKSKKTQIEGLEVELQGKSELLASLETKMHVQQADFDMKIKEVTRAFEKEKNESKKEAQQSQGKPSTDPETESRLSDLNKKIQVISMNYEEVKSRNERLEESNEELLNKLNDYQTVIENLEVELQHADAKLGEVEQDSKNKIQEFINVFNENNPKKIHDLNVNHVNELSQQNQNLKIQLEELNIYSKDLEAKIESVENEKIEMQEEFLNMREYIESIDKSNAQNLDSERNLEEKEDANAMVIELEKIIVRLNDEQKDQQRKEKNLEKELNNNQEVIRKLNLENQNLASQKVSIDAQLKESVLNAGKLEALVSNLTSQIENSKKEQASQLSAENTLSVEIEKYKNQIKLLEGQINEEAQARKVSEQNYNNLNKSQECLVSRSFLDETRAEADSKIHALDLKLKEKTGLVEKLRISEEQMSRERSGLEVKVAEMQANEKVLRAEIESLQVKMKNAGVDSSQASEKEQKIQNLTSECQKLQKAQIDALQQVKNYETLVKHTEQIINSLSQEINILCTDSGLTAALADKLKFVSFSFLTKTQQPENYINDLFKEMKGLNQVKKNEFAEVEAELQKTKTILEETKKTVQELTSVKSKTDNPDAKETSNNQQDEEETLKVTEMISDEIIGGMNDKSKEIIQQKDELIEELNQQIQILNNKFQEVSTEFFEKSKAAMNPIKEDIDLGEEVSKIEVLFDEILQTYEDDVTQDEFKYVMTNLKLALDEFMTKAHAVIEAKQGDAENKDENGSQTKEELAHRVSEFEEQFHEMESELNLREERIRELETNYENAVGALEETKDECDYLKETCEKLDLQLNSKKTPKIIEVEADYKNQINTIKQETRDLKKKIRELEKENNTYQTEIQEKEAQMETMQKDVEKAFEETTEEYNSKIQEKEVEIEKLHRKLAKKTDGKEQEDQGDLLAENEELKEYLQELNQHKQYLEEQMEEKDQMIKELSDLNDQLKMKGSQSSKPEPTKSNFLQKKR